MGSITINIAYYDMETYIDVLKGIERITLIVTPVINSECLHTPKQCILKHNSIHLDSIIVIKLLNLINAKNISCLITLCRPLTPLIKSITNSLPSVSIIELCSGDITIPKHRYDSILKCISYSDALIIVTRRSFIPRPIINIIPLAEAFNEKIFIFNL
ncbi:MAG: hypothetical protein QXO42_00530 [Ignisphaera sp.]